MTGFEALNLLRNLEHRSTSSKARATLDPNVPTTLSEETCFKSSFDQIRANGDKFIIGLDFGESVFMHAIVHAQDFLGNFSFGCCFTKYFPNHF